MIKEFLDLGKQPLANNYLTKKNLKKKEDFYNLKIGFDKKTKFVSIINTVAAKRMFNNKYPYRSSMSKTMNQSFKRLSKYIKKKFEPRFVMEIGSNDGSFIKNFSKKKSICIEPCKNISLLTKKKGYQTYQNYWSIKLAKKIKNKNNKIDIIYSANTLSHIKNLNSVFKSITHVLSDTGVLILEDPSLLECLKKVSYDQFYNEHIYVFSLIAIDNLIKKYKLEIFNIKKLSVHGGSLRYYIKKISNKKYKINKKIKQYKREEIKFGLEKYNTYIKFGKSVKKSRVKLKNIFNIIKKKNKKIIGYGSTAKATTILNYCKINKKTINYFLDTTPDKIGKYMPGSKIYIKKYKKPLSNEADYVFLGAWNFKKEIFEKEKKFIQNGGKFITHVPFPQII